MNMTTSIDNIPMKTNTNDIPNDDSDDPIVKDILNEFQQELKSVNQEPSTNYNINYQPPPPPSPPPQQPPSRPPIYQQLQQPPKRTSSSFYNEDLIRKTGIIIIIIAMVFSPLILPAFINKLPPSISLIIDNYQFYFKLLLLFIIIYIMFIKELI